MSVCATTKQKCGSGPGGECQSHPRNRKPAGALDFGRCLHEPLPQAHRMASKEWQCKSFFPKTKIKAVMQEDDEIGSIATIVLPMMSKCTELFAKDMVEAACAAAEQRGHHTIEPPHLKQAVLEKKEYDFLKGAVEDLDDVSTVKQKQPKNRKRKKAPSTSSSGIAATTATSAKTKPKRLDAVPAISAKPEASHKDKTLDSSSKSVIKDIASGGMLSGIMGNTTGAPLGTDTSGMGFSVGVVDDDDDFD